MSLRTPLGRVRGLGSAKEGTHHWWMQRVTAVALVPLTLWLVVVIIRLSSAGFEQANDFVANPLVMVGLLLALGVMFYHAQLGLQVVIEDYVHTEWLKLTSLIGMKFTCVALAVASAVAVIRIGLGA